MNKNNKNKLVTSIISVLVLMLIVGTTYAAFTFSKGGTKAIAQLPTRSHGLVLV